MVEILSHFENEAAKKAFVIENELKYRSQIKIAAEKIVSASPKFLLLSGATCAGKTTTSHILSDEIVALGKHVKIISIDDFYFDREYTDKNNIDLESIDAIDLLYFEKCATDIFEKKSTMLPIFDFVSGKRIKYREFNPHDDEIVVWEGIQAFYPEILSVLPQNTYKKIYLDMPKEIVICGEIFSPRDVRFYRRLVRDCKFRGASVDYVLALWPNVIANEEKNMFPYSDTADYFIDTFLRYDLYVIKDYLLSELSYTNVRERKLYNNIKESFENIPSISSDYIPEDSLFREFLGSKD